METNILPIHFIQTKIVRIMSCNLRNYITKLKYLITHKHKAIK